MLVLENSDIKRFKLVFMISLYHTKHDIHYLLPIEEPRIDDP
jgi:hypothetical protein